MEAIAILSLIFGALGIFGVLSYFYTKRRDKEKDIKELNKETVYIINNLKLDNERYILPLHGSGSNGLIRLYLKSDSAEHGNLELKLIESFNDIELSLEKTKFNIPIGRDPFVVRVVSKVQNYLLLKSKNTEIRFDLIVKPHGMKEFVVKFKTELR